MTDVASSVNLETVTSTDGTEIAYERTGNGPPLVLVHGSTADHTRWEPIHPAIAADHTVYALDRRGRGASWDAPEYSIDREAEDVAAVVDSIDEPVNLLGHSYGAICSLEATLRTDNLRTLVLYEPPISIDGSVPDNEPVLVEMEGLIDDGEREAALVLFLRDVAGMPSEELDALRSAPNWPARVDAVHTVVREERTRAVYEFDPARFSTIRTPTLLLGGGESPTFYETALVALNEALPDSRVVVLAGQAHAAMNTAPDRFVEAVLSFVRKPSG